METAENTAQLNGTTCNLNVESSAAPEEPTFTVDEAVNKVGFGFFQYRLLFLTGLAWAADSFEIIILSIIGQILSCEWEIQRWQNALLTTGVFLGMILGCPTYGIIADKYGRKKSLGLSLIVMFCSGALSAASPSYYWMLGFRTVTGFSLGGVGQALTLCCEYVSADIRGKMGLYLCYFWSLGTVGVIMVAWVVMQNTGNWRLLLAVTAIPALIILLCLKWLPESPRYYMVSDKYKEAEELITQMAKMNGKELPPGKLNPAVKCEKRGHIADLFLPNYRLSTILLCYMSMTSALCYYSMALITPIIIQKKSLAAINNNSEISSYTDGFVGPEPCEKLTQRNYIDLLWTSAAEFPGLIVFTFLVEVLGRKKLTFGSCVISGLLVLLLLVPTKIDIIPLLLLFGARGIILALFQLVYIMTSEAFPTTLRAVAVGTGSAMMRFGGLLSPYLSEILVVTNPYAAVGLIGAIIISTGLAALCLPLETKGVALPDSHEEKAEDKHEI